MASGKPAFTAAGLTPGRTYQVVAPFTDYDGFLHPAGERWRFTRKDFLPYEDGLTLFVESDQERFTVRLQWRPEAQAAIIENFSNFVQEAG